MLTKEREESLRSLLVKNKIFNQISRVCISLLFVFIISFFSYIFYQGFFGLQSYGFSQIFLSTEFNLKSSGGGVSFWSPLFITIFLALSVIILTIPISLRISIWMSFYCRKNIKKILNFLIILTSNIPSVIMGLFAKENMGWFLKQIFFLNSSLNLITAIFALHFMVLPVCILFFNSVLENKQEYIISSQALGIDKNYSIYKILIPKIKTTIYFVITVVFGRVISESIMLSMILSNEQYSTYLKGGILKFLNSQLNPLSPLISGNFFTEQAKAQQQSLMFFFSGMLLVTSWVFNSVFYFFTHKCNEEKMERYCLIRSMIIKIKKIKNYIKRKILWNINKLSIGNENIKKIETNLEEYLLIKEKNNKFERFLLRIRKISEWMSISIFVIFISSMIGVIFYKGSEGFVNLESNGIPDNNTLGRAVLNTFLIIFFAIILLIPFSIISALYLSEYCKNKRIKKLLLNLLNFASGTPSIIYGLFGLSFFILNLGLTSQGVKGKSLLAGILTIVLLILPNLTQMFYSHLSDISDEYRIASYCLGMTKYQTIKKIIIPLAFSNILSAVMINMGKIIGETAPFYLTSGLTSISSTSLMYPGQTLTTRIYSQLSENGNKMVQARYKMFTTAMCIFLIISLCIYLNRILIPYITKISKYPAKIVLTYYKNKWNYLYKYYDLKLWKIHHFFFKLLL